MQNPILPKEDIEKIKEVIEKVNIYIDSHQKISPNISDVGSRLNRVHTMLYLEIVKDLITNVKMLEQILECSPEEFEKIFTEDGETLENVERMLMANMMLNILSND